MSVLFRTQEWLADRVSWVQYPRIRRERPASRYEGRKLSFAEAVLLFCYAVAAGVVGLIAIAAGCFILYVIVSSLF